MSDILGDVITFRLMSEALEEQRCPQCHGIGKCDDADFGDIFYNEWVCPACGGTGMKGTHNG